jgi:hypothetical protein
MAGQDTAAYDEVLKIVYEGGIRELLPTKVKTLKLFENRDAKDWGGKFVEYPARIGRNQGSGWGSELGNLPAAGRQRYTDWRIPIRYQYGRIQLSAQVMKASQGNRHAFASAMSQEMDGLLTDMTADRGRAMLYDGRGVLALVNGTSTGSTVTVDAPGGVAGATNGARFINPGMVIAGIVPATGAIRASSIHTVQSVAAAGTSYTATAAVAGITDNDYLVRAMHASITDVADTSYQKEFTGLLGLVDDGTYLATLHNVNRTTFPITQSTVIGSVAGLSADVIQRAIDLADQRGDGDTSDLIMHHSVRRAYLAMTDADRRYTGGDLSSPDAGTVAAKKGRLTFGGIPILEEKYAPYGMVFGIDRSGFSRYVLVAGEWADEDGAVLSRVGSGATGVDAFEAHYRIWDEFHNDYAARCWRLDGVTATVAVAHIE